MTALGRSLGRRLAAAAASGVLGASGAGAQTGVGPAVILGHVRDRLERPLAGVTVRFEDAELETRTGDDGAFALSIDFVPDGVVLFRQVGYAPARATVKLARGDTVRLVAHLARLDLLDTVRTVAGAPAAVSARLAGFEARRARGRGVFVTREEFERQNPLNTTDVLRRTGAVLIVDSLGVLLPSSTRGGRWDSKLRRYDRICIMRVAVDGITMPQAFSLREMPGPKEIAGIEIYQGGATMPAEFGGARSDMLCGLIAIWTRDR